MAYGAYVWNGVKWVGTIGSPDLYSMTFLYYGAPYSFVVPDLVTTIHVDAWGAQGGRGNANGSLLELAGLGAYAECDISVTPGETLTIYVGGAGRDGITSGQNAAGGYNGGGLGRGGGSYSGGSGGGGSDVRQGGTALANRVVVAGAGGGGGADGSGPGGQGGHGGLVGTAGGSNSTNGGGQGGTGSAGGAAGVTGSSQTAGSLGVGGNGADNTRDGGGGGGGLYGGGGGGAESSVGGSGGGGGSSLITLGGSVTTGARTGDGLVILTW